MFYNRLTDAGQTLKKHQRNKMKEKKRNRRDRYDGWFVEESDPMHNLMPYMIPNRADNEAVLAETIDMSAVEEYINKKNADNPEFKYTFFHFIVAAFAKTIVLRPHMNRFYAGFRLYDRKEIVFAFNIKKKFSDEAEEVLARIVFDKDSDESPLEQIHRKIRDVVYSARKKGEDAATDQMNILLKLPRPLLKIVVKILDWLDYHGKYPKDFYYVDPYFSSVFVSNLGSIKMHADYHHLANRGTNSIFLVIGEKGPTAFPKADGTVEVKTGIKLGITIDERIADGYYFSQTLKIVRKLFENPELIEHNVNESVEV